MPAGAERMPDRAGTGGGKTHRVLVFFAIFFAATARRDGAPGPAGFAANADLHQCWTQPDVYLLRVNEP